MAPEFKMDQRHIDAVTEILNIGVSKADESIRQLSGQDVSLDALRVRVLARNPNEKVLGELNEVRHYSYINFNGAFSGSISISLSDPCAVALTELLTGAPCGEDEDELLVEEAMMEVSNIVLCNMMGAVGNVFKKKLEFNTPYYLISPKGHSFFDVHEENFTSSKLLATTAFDIAEQHIEGKIRMYFNVESMLQFLEAIDVTDLSQHLAQYRKMRDKAMFELSERKKLQKDLRISNDSLRSFADKVSHDLRMPLSTMVNLAECFSDQASDPQLVRENANVLKRNAHRALQIIDGIATLTGVQNETPKFEKVELQSLVQGVVDTIDGKPKDGSVQVDLDCRHSVLAAANMLPQVFQNLIINAIKFTSLVRSPKIWIRSEMQGEAIRVCVEDNGPGIPVAKREKVFSAFERLHGEEVEGMGLGLNIAKTIMDLHPGGRIQVVDSKKLGGARFEICLLPEASVV